MIREDIARQSNKNGFAYPPKTAAAGVLKLGILSKYYIKSVKQEFQEKRDIPSLISKLAFLRSAGGPRRKV